METAEEAAERELARWQNAAAREAWRWANRDRCSQCGQWVGHWGGDATTDPCDLIPQDLPLEEVRPNCYMLRRHRLVDAIRHASKG